MTSIDFLNKVHKSLDSQEYNLSYSPAKSKNYMLYCNGNFIGGLFDEELCFVYADSVSELLGQPEPVYHGYSSTAQHRMLVIPEEHWAKALKLLYAEKFDWSRLVYDITYTSIGAAVVEDFYDENVVFLRFCFEKELLKKDPLDRQGRILRMVYLNQDLTKAGKYLFPRLMQKFLVFTDRNGKTSLETMLKRWYTQLILQLLLLSYRLTCYLRSFIIFSMHSTTCSIFISDVSTKTASSACFKGDISLCIS